MSLMKPKKPSHPKSLMTLSENESFHGVTIIVPPMSASPEDTVQSKRTDPNSLIWFRWSPEDVVRAIMLIRINPTLERFWHSPSTLKKLLNCSTKSHPIFRKGFESRLVNHLFIMLVLIIIKGESYQVVRSLELKRSNWIWSSNDQLNCIEKFCEFHDYPLFKLWYQGALQCPQWIARIIRRDLQHPHPQWQSLISVTRRHHHCDSTTGNKILTLHILKPWSQQGFYCYVKKRMKSTHR